jgi:cytoskeletal protein RodZ
MSKKRKNTSSLALLCVVLVVLIFTVAIVSYRHKSVPSTSVNTVSTPTPISKPGQPGNPGDVAKTSIPTPSPESKTAPTSSAVPASELDVSIDTITPRSDGSLGVANTVKGASSGSCTLELTDPSNQKTTVFGSIHPSGPSFFCSFEPITGVTKSGTWSARLSATSGAKSGFQLMNFKKE